MAELGAGSLFAGYQIEAVLGQGGMGTVYRARNLKLERPVALKVIASTLAQDPRFRERFRREAMAAASIEHPHVVPVYEADEYDGTPFLAMRLVEGADLGTLIAVQGPLSTDLVVRVIEQIASALDAAHTRGLVHRDIKPANVLVTGERGYEHAYLTDFGIAKRAGADEPLTRTGALIGTLDYIAPEAFRGEPVAAPADVYALGCVLFELLVGEVPFPRDTAAEKISAALYEPPPSVCNRVGGLPRGLDETISRALAKRPSERFTSSGELARHTSAALAGYPPRSLSIVTSPVDATTGGAAPSEAARKQITVLCCMPVPAAGQSEPDPEVLPAASGPFFEAAAEAIERNGGSVMKADGEAIVGTFGLRELREDDALRAVRAALELHESLASEPRTGPVVPSTAINTGVALVQRTGREVGGLAAIIRGAMRALQFADPGVIVVSESTRPLVEQGTKLDPHGKGATPAWRVRYLLPDAELLARNLRAPLVGRRRELEQLEQALAYVGENRSASLVTVLGAPGVGKTRLAAEFKRRIAGRAELVVGRCRPTGQGTTWSPVSQALQQILRLPSGAAASEAPGREADAGTLGQIVAELTSAEEIRTSPQEIFWALQQMLATAAHRRPLVVVFEDIHWADPTILDLIEQVAEWSRDIPLLLLCLARPDLVGERPRWGGGRFNSRSMLLESLSRTECEALIADMPSAAELDAPVRERIIERAEGNPLFLEQMLALARDTGDNAPTPSSIQLLLAARLDQLPAPERDAACRAAVVGTEFTLRSVGALLPDADEKNVAASLRALVQTDFIEPVPTARSSRDRFHFRHTLIRDAAYDALPKRGRADLHEQLADWLERDESEHPPDHDEILGYHLEQAYRYCTELGPADDHAHRLAAKARERLTLAGRRAVTRENATAAASLLERAVALYQSSNGVPSQLLLDLAGARADIGQLESAALLIDQVLEVAVRSDKPVLEWRARVQRASLGFSLASDFKAPLAETKKAIDALTELGDERALGQAWTAHARNLAVLGDVAGALAAYEQALLFARRHGDRRVRTEALTWILIFVWGGPTPARAGLERCQEVLAEPDVPRQVMACALIEQAPLLAMLGRFGEARDRYAEGAGILNEVGLTLLAAQTTQEISEVEMLAGNPEAAERWLRSGCDRLEAMGEQGILASSLPRLGEALYAQGQYQQAKAMAQRGREFTVADDIDADMRSRRLQAKLLARHQQFTAAEHLARQAVQLSERTDITSERGTTLMDLAEVLVLAGHARQARATIARALEHFELKENVISAQRAREHLTATDDPNPETSKALFQ